MSSVSNGQLLAMTDERRAEVVAAMPRPQRRALARIAVLGAQRHSEKAGTHTRHGETAWSEQASTHAAELSGLAAELLKGDDGLA